MIKVYGEEYEFLLDLKSDPDETKNVFDQPGYEAVSKYARKKLNGLLEKEGIGLCFQ